MKLHFFALLYLIPACGALAAGTSHPNILFLLTDQQHAGMLSCAGNPWVKTPAIDSLAAKGARFGRAYCANPVCVPSRTSLLTGYTPSRFGMQSNNDLPTTLIPPEIQRQTLGCLFRDAGYDTVYGGKTHVPGKIKNYGFNVLTADQRDELATECAAYLKRPHDRPFLLVASFINPHDICYMAISDFEKSQPGEQPDHGPAGKCLAEALRLPPGVSGEDFYAKLCPPAPANLEPQAAAPDALQISLTSKGRESFRQHAFRTWSTEQWRLHRWAYCRLTERVDAEIGQVLSALRESGLEDNTLVVFSSDHGDMDGSHRLEHKSMFYEEASHVPFIVSLKGVTKPGLVDNQHLVSTGLDLIPTLCEFAGITPPSGLLGRSVRCLAEGREPPSWRPYLAAETHYGRMICSGRFKYCVYDSGKLREQLVDLQADPGEMTNRAADPALATELDRHRQFMREWVDLNRDQFASSYLIR